MKQFDVAIIGSGLAGLTTALQLADKLKVAIICKRSVSDSASRWAQGGIAAVRDPADSVAEHVQDTLVAGGGLCERDAVQFILENASKSIDWLVEQGVPFSREDEEGPSNTEPNGFHLTREGGHSRRRILHVADATGDAVQTTLEAKARNHPNIQLFEHHMVIDLITGDRLSEKKAGILGAYILDEQSQRVLTLTCPYIVLACGGAGKVYNYTTNPDTATGDGIAMAWRAGCRISNMEFIQFHPTCLYHPYAKSFLITEAVRGEGGLLKLPDGTRFMPEHDERAELAPRDVVARAIDFEMKKRGLDCVYLDISHEPAEKLKKHFPTIYKRCLELGIDITKQGIPVVPAAHYTCGGVVTDHNARTDIPGLYAVGETAYTGLHGANRLASNSLLECVVLGQAAANHILTKPHRETMGLPDWDESRVTDPDEEVVISHNWAELRQTMWNYVGIVRTDKRLERAQHRIQLLREEILEFYSNFRVSRDLLELRNLVDVADLIVTSALSRKESRGLHFSADYPGTLPKAFPTVLQRPKKK
ncbi:MULTISPECIES: L-aspartate oxidase [unclassified Limnobacter]|jgi:L-aspartate oxidase|uniref:L-aspartate oxidase n=1 Tax=unclassified Limnobacter TaxID=2630203 RepID=UPI000156CD7C|nr:MULTISPECIES: L-aspartate oxidase [unclassified Limnobacter]EDM83898.1 L-aspartate oxidase [Limnobacter sp. MED105]|tara:strand:+ start:4186 stop:5787 length:1602 start_codon:yes stop_codon:yes gene_type:complete